MHDLHVNVDLQRVQNRSRHFLATKRYTQEVQCKLKPEVKLNHHSHQPLLEQYHCFPLLEASSTVVTDINEEPIHTSYLILTSSSFLPLSTAIVFKELFTKINPSNFLVSLVGLQIVKLKRKGNQRTGKVTGEVQTH